MPAKTYRMLKKQEQVATYVTNSNKRLRQKAQSHIDRKSQLAMDICTEAGQMFDNVKHMKWLLEAVIERIR